jgi:hypothetical protein
MRLRLCGAAIAVMLVVAGCGGGSDSGSSTSASTSSSTSTNAGTTTGTTTSATTGTTSRPTRAIRDTPETPVFYINRYPKPSNPGPHAGARVHRLIVRDIRKGAGLEIHSGDSGIFEFISTNWVTGAPLEEAWHRRRPYITQIEHNVVIDGWWQGIPGMRAGGRRQIVIPPSLGFMTNPELVGATTYFDVVLDQVIRQRPTGLGGRAAPREAVRVIQ